MNKSLLYILLFFSALFPVASLFAQTRVVTGTVADKLGKDSLVGAN